MALGQTIILAYILDALLLGTGLVAAAIFYLFAEILHYRVVRMPSLGPWRWLRYGWMALFLLLGVPLIILGLALFTRPLAEVAAALSGVGTALYSIPLPAQVRSVVGAVLSLLCALPLVLIGIWGLVLRNIIDDVRDALDWHNWRKAELRSRSDATHST